MMKVKDLVQQLNFYSAIYSEGRSLGRIVEGTSVLMSEAANVISSMSDDRLNEELEQRVRELESKVKDLQFEIDKKDYALSLSKGRDVEEEFDWLLEI